MIVLDQKSGMKFDVPNDMSPSDIKSTIAGFSAPESAENAIASKAEEFGSISSHEPTFKEKFVDPALEAVGLDKGKVSPNVPPRERAYDKFVGNITYDVPGFDGVDITQSGVGDLRTSFNDSRIVADRTNAFMSGLFNRLSFGAYSGKDESAERELYPVSNLVGTGAGELGAFLVTGGLLRASKLAPVAVDAGIKAMKYSEKALRFVPRMIMSGSTFAGKTMINKIIEQAQEQKFDIVDMGKSVLMDGLLGSTLGGISGLYGAKTAISSAAAIGYIYAKAEGMEDPEAIMMAAVFAGFEAVGSIGRNKKMAIEVMSNFEKTLFNYYRTSNPDVGVKAAYEATIGTMQTTANKLGFKCVDDLIKVGLTEGNGKSFFQFFEKMNQAMRSTRPRGPVKVPKIGTKAGVKVSPDNPRTPPGKQKPKKLEVDEVKYLERKLNELPEEPRKLVESFLKNEFAGKQITPEAVKEVARIIKMAETLSGDDANKVFQDLQTMFLGEQTPVKPKAVAPKKLPAGKEIFYTKNLDATKQSEEFVEVEARPIKIKGHPKHDFFVMKNQQGTWIVSEARSGLAVSSGSGMKKNTMDEAIRMAKIGLDVRKDKLDEVVSGAVERRGLSPRYDPKTNKVKVQPKPEKPSAPVEPKKPTPDEFVEGRAKQGKWSKQGLPRFHDVLQDLKDKYGSANEYTTKEGVTVKISQDVIGKGGLQTFRRSKGADDNQVFIDTIESKDKGKGAASKALKEITDSADKRGVELVLHPRIFKKERGQLSYDQLREWYGRKGFVDGEDGSMIRKPLTAEYNAKYGEKPQASPSDSPATSKRPVKPIITQARKEKMAKDKEVKKKQENLESAKDAKTGMHRAIMDRRFALNMAAFETNAFTHEIDRVTTLAQRQVIPFLIENTDIPKELNRTDLEKIYAEQKDELMPIALQVKERFDKSWQYMKANMDKLDVDQIQDYVNHIWDIPKKSRPMTTAWFTTQNKFLKKRFIATYKEGIQKGLKPKTLDISELIRIHDQAMNRAIENQKVVEVLKELTQDGVPVAMRSDLAPQDWVLIDHPALREGLIVPGQIQSGEKVGDDLIAILNEMGIAIGRRISPVAFGKPVFAAGLAYKEKKEIRLQRFFQTSTVAHEVGHHLDWILKLGDGFVKKYKNELLALNKERIERIRKNPAPSKYGGSKYAEKTEEQIAELFAFIFTDIEKAMKLAPNATVDVLQRLRADNVLTKLVDLKFETKAKSLIQEQLSKFVKLPIKVHPDVAPILNIIFESRISFANEKLDAIRKGYEVLNHYFKKGMLSLSFFHAGALSETGVPMLGLGKTLGIMFNLPKIYKAVAKGELDVYKDIPMAKRWIKRGLQLGATADIPVAKIQKNLNDLRDKTHGIPVVAQTTEFISSFNKAWDTALWDYLHDSLKLQGAEAMASKIDPKGDIQKQEEEIAQIINDTFGGQNWETLMVSPRTLQVMSWLLLSPDWTLSTLRQALSVTGVGNIHDETKGIRTEIGRMFWIKAAIYFGVGINLLNVAMRKYDYSKEENKKYYGEEDFKWHEYTMFGNTIGHKTHLFGGRNKDGTEIYLRWGKQFRELAEFFFDYSGFSPITASLKKIGGKTAPALQSISTVMTGRTPSGYTIRDIDGQQGWDKVWAITKHLMLTPVPFTLRSMTEEGREFHITDFVMPSSKGMTRYKAIDLFKNAIEHKNERLFKEVWKGSIRNGISPYELSKVATQTLKAESTRDTLSTIKNLEQAEVALKNADDPNDMRALMSRIKRLTKEKMHLENGASLLDKALAELEFERMKGTI